jgi:hypothetical protein
MHKFFSKILIIIFPGIIFIVGGITQKISCAQGIIDDDFNILKSEFKHPSREFGTIPFFVWNDIITKDGINEIMNYYKNNGFGGVIVHPRPGLITGYLSDSWFDLFRYTVEKGKKLDLNVWIYDENSYPSGFAGGHVPAQMSESYNLGQGLQPLDTNMIPQLYEKYFLILKNENGKYIDITDIANLYVGKIGDYTLFSKTFYRQSDWFAGFSYVDLLYPGVTQKFIEVTMTGYQKVAREEFGGIVQGVFTDEPEISSPGGIRWTPDLFDVFKKQWGYDLKVNLPLLYKQVDDWKKVRHNYTKTLLKLFIERWSMPYYDFLEKAGLKFTGHYWEHGWPSMRFGGDNMAMYAYHQVPGIDMLGNKFDEYSPNAQFGNIRAVKELSSVANQLGLKRTLSETYGGAGWEITFKELKRLGDWEFVLGVNLMNPCISFYTIAGARKYDYPPSFSYHNPWMNSFKYLNDYFARLSVALSSGVQKNEILIIEPTTTAWLYDSYIYKKQNRKLYEIGQNFQKFITTLEKNQIEYDLGSEDIIRKHGYTSKNEFIIGQAAYSKIVIPPLTETLNKSTFNLIKQFVSNGGEIIMFSVPTLVDGTPNDDIINFFKHKTANIIHLHELNTQTISTYFQSNGLKFEDVNGGNLFHHRRRLQNGQIVFLVNSSAKNATSGSIIIDGNDAVLLNAFSGEISDYREENISNNFIRLNFSLYPAESLLLYVSDIKLKDYNKQIVKNDELVPVMTKFDITVKRDKENTILIDFCDLQIAGKKERDLHVYDASEMAYIENGFKNGNPWNHAVQFKTLILDTANFSPNSGFVATYNFVIKEEFNYTNLKAVIERPHLWNVSINGHDIIHEAGKWWLDHSFGIYSIGKWIRPGINHISLKCFPMKIHAEIEPIYILGDFSVEPASKGWVIIPESELSVGSWKEQGLPFYPWDMSYSKKFEIQEKSSFYEVGLGNWKGTVAEVIVNGKDAGTIALPSDRVEVSKFITEGINDIEVKITGSLKNLLGPHHNNPGLGIIGPGNWRNIKKYPNGESYHLLDYGLMDDFYLYCSQ